MISQCIGIWELSKGEKGWDDIYSLIPFCSLFIETKEISFRLGWYFA